jgi:hypothetical protein
MTASLQPKNQAKMIEIRNFLKMLPKKTIKNKKFIDFV